VADARIGNLNLGAPASAGHSAELTKLMDELVIPLYALRARRKGYEVSAMRAMMDMIGLSADWVVRFGVSRQPAELKANRPAALAGHQFLKRKTVRRKPVRRTSEGRISSMTVLKHNDQTVRDSSDRLTVGRNRATCWNWI